jgi:hypothetical protein
VQRPSKVVRWQKARIIKGPATGQEVWVEQARPQAMVVRSWPTLGELYHTEDGVWLNIVDELGYLCVASLGFLELLPEFMDKVECVSLSAFTAAIKVQSLPIII